MKKIVLSSNFSVQSWHDYFDSISNHYRELNISERQLEDDHFTSVLRLGVFEFPQNEAVNVFILMSQRTMNERFNRKRQYDKSVSILKDTSSQAGLFIFYDTDFSFRFSFVYPIYQYTKRKFSTYKRFSYYLWRTQATQAHRLSKLLTVDALWITLLCKALCCCGLFYVTTLCYKRLYCANIINIWSFRQCQRKILKLGCT